MTKRLLCAIVAATCLAVPASAQAGWQELTDGTLRADPAADARATDVVTVGGVPYLAWSEGVSDSTDIRVARLGDDGAWEVLDSPDPSGRSWSIEPALADVGGVLHVAWAERDTRLSDNRFQVQVARLDGDDFVPVAATPTPATAGARDPVLADVGGTVHVAWVEGDRQSFDIRAARLQAGAWQPTGSIDHSTREAEASASNPLSLLTPVTRLNSSDPDLAVIGGALHVAWSEGGFAYLARLDGNSWTELGGGAANGAGDGAEQTTIAGVDGVPFVAWRSADGANRLRVSSLAGAAWPDEPTSISGSQAIEPALHAAGDTAWLAWVQAGGLRVTRLTGGAWQEPADAALNELGGTRASSAALTSVSGIPVAAWSEGYAGGRTDAKLARLQPDVLGTEVTPAAMTATAVASLRTFGLGYRVSFAYGPAGSALAQRTPTTAATESVSALLTELAPRTAYEARLVVEMPVGADLSGPTVGFTTTKRNGKPG